jgi:hypothetical protein
VQAWEDESDLFANQPAWWPCKHPRLHAPASSDANAAAEAGAARAAVEAAQHTVWTPAREGALLAALAATPEYAAGQRLPDERWLEIAATLAEPGWTPHGLTAVKS